MTLLTQLKQLGFTPNESLVYTILFESGGTKAGEIIRKTGLHRNLVYVALQSLVDRKLAIISKVRGIAMYKPLSPNRLLSEVQEKERVAKEVIEELAASKKSVAQEIVVYEGVEEFRRHVLHTFTSVKPNTLIRYLGISPAWYDIVGDKLQEKLLGIQKEKKIKMKALASGISQADKDFLKSAREWAEVKLCPLISDDTSGIEILDERISIRSFVEPYFVVEITHKQLAKNYQNHFDFLWQLKKFAK